MTRGVIRVDLKQGFKEYGWMKKSFMQKMTRGVIIVDLKQG